MDVFWSASLVSRTLAALTFTQSALVYGGLLGGYLIVFLPWEILKLPPEIWRLFTPFFLTGPDLDFVFDLYLLYTYSSSLETDSPRFNGPGDFLIYVLFVGAVIVLTAGCLIRGVIFNSALILAFVYTWAQDNPGRKVTFWVAQIQAQWLPWAILTITLIRSGWGAVKVHGTGILAAHLYDFLTRIYPAFGGGRKYIATPAFVQKLFNGQRGTSRAYGTAYRPGRQSAQRQQFTQRPSSSGSGSSFGGSWSSRGAGRRLGGD